MKKYKKMFKGLTLPLAIAGILCSGGFLINNNVENTAKTSYADFSVVETLKKDTPDYVKIKPQTDGDGKAVISSANENLFLFQAEQYFNIQIADNEISGYGYKYNTDTKQNESVSGINFGYQPDLENTQQYYYFDFQSSLSLYYNITAQDLALGLTSKNLIQNQNISNYTSTHKNKFTPNDTSFTPQQFDIQFKLDLQQQDDVTFLNKTVTLKQEGCYTLVVPVVEYYTNNGGASFSAQENTIYYTFMAFNANTYFDSTTGNPKLKTSDNLHQTLLGSSSSDFSTYYYYNFGYAEKTKDGEIINTLPEITFNPNHYQLRINYADIDGNLSVSNIQYQNNKVVQLDKNGNEIKEEDEFVKVRKDKDGNAKVIFYDLGSYDINITYLYTKTNENGSITYQLPFENLDKNSNTIFKNKAQRLYIYGYQAVYSNYSQINTKTNQPESKDLKIYNFENATYTNSADITSLINARADLSNSAQPETFEIEEIVKTTIDESLNDKDKSNDILPISTNQTPIKFLTNAKNANTTDNIVSTIYTRTKDGWKDKTEPFQGFNQNSAGTYLYIIQYTFDSYMSTSGTLQSSYYNYQIFYFTITNTAPSVDVFAMDESYSEIYTNGFTNKSVYILNNSENNIYDAKVDVTLSAKNYVTGNYYFKDINIKNLSTYGFYYQKFAKNTELEDDSPYNQKIADKYGLLIENTNRYANAEFTIKVSSISSKNTSDQEETPISTRKFTIDTNQISGIETRTVSVQSSTTYRILNSFDSFVSNTPFVFSWDEKLSGAQTYGYVKYIPTTSINYYSSLDDNNLAELLARLVGTHDTLPVSYKIDLSKAATTNWTEYKNSTDYTSTISSSYVKSSDGFYILEVYDQAGNVSFEIFLLDSSAPIFIEEISGDTTTQKILSGSQSITVPENDVDITIKWTKNKAIYLENMLSDWTSVTAYPYGINSEYATIVLQDKLTQFFTTENSSISYFNDITADTSNEGITTGISSFNGNYLLIPINDIAYIKEGSSSGYQAFNTSSYKIKFFDENGNLIADNQTFKILLRDASNTYISNNQDINYKNYPSAYISFNVTSDASKLSLQSLDQNGDWENLDFAGYSMNGLLYSYTDKNGNVVYTHIADTSAVNESGEKIYSETDLGYKYSYYTPINGKKELQLSYIPIAENGSKLEKIVLKYYEYVLTSATYDQENYNHYYDKETGKTIYTEGKQNTYYYYDIAKEPTKIVNIFPSSEKNYDQGQVETFSVALGNDDYPLAGRYVVERTYMEDSETGKYDYYKRIITFTIDNFNLISPLESITEGDNSSLESVVGGEILLSMYSGEDNSAIQVSFPTYKENGLNSGSFYTADSFNQNEHLKTYSVEGNKLPMSLYIPKNKYTISNSRNINEEKQSVTYSVNKNDNLSYYGNARYKYNTKSQLYDVYVEGVVVESFVNEQQAKNYVNKTSVFEYQIYAEITATVTENNVETVKYYYSNGNETNGYLIFYPGDKDGNITSTTPVDYFYLKGNYVVTIYQANNLGSTSDFYTFYKFGFKIISQSPDFDVIGSNGYELTQTNKQNVYYTNSSELKVQWEDPINQFEAKIDEKEIEIKTSNGLALPISDIETDANTKYFTIDTTALIDNFSTNTWLEITMQYEGHNKDFYSTITKTIYFDRSAPTQNIRNLIMLTENATSGLFTSNYQLMFMRKYADYNGNEVSLQSLNDIEKLSYNYSVDNGYFKYFSYNVTTDYFNTTLLQTIENADNNPLDTQSIYYKAIEDINTYTQVDKASFSAGNYYYITSDETAIIYCGYYEVVEMDYAGNMTVYLVYVVDSVSEDDANIQKEALAYSNNKTIENEKVLNSEITEGFNIYSTSGFEIESLSYQADPWNFMIVQIAGQSETRYLKSPWLNENQIYQISLSSSGINFNQVTLQSIFENVDSSSNKHRINLGDRVSGNNYNIYLSIMDASLSPEKVVDPSKTSAILNINIPTLAEVQSTTKSYVYPVNIEIHQYDPNMEGDDNWQLKMIADQEPYGTWNAQEGYEDALNYISFKTLAGGKTLQVKIELGANATQKVKYVITDNFGSKSTIIQLANEVSYREISGSSIIYTDYEFDGTVTYLSDNAINYSYNVLLYTIEIFDKNGLEITDTITHDPDPVTNISVVPFIPTSENYYDDYFKINVWDIEIESDKPLKTIHIRLYNKLPFRSSDEKDVENGAILFNDKNQQPINEDNITSIPSETITFEGKSYSSSADSVVTFSRNVTLRFKNGQDLAAEGNYTYQFGYTYSVYLSRDNGITWENINTNNSETSGYTISGVGDYLIFIKYDSEEYFTNLCKIFTLTILDSSTSYYYITVDGVKVEKSDVKYLSINKREYDVNYIVAVEYPDRDNRVKITKNEELGVTIERLEVDNTGSLVSVEIYHYECEEAIGDFTIIYIASTNNIVNTLTYETASGSTVSIKDNNSATVIANNETEPNFNKLKINFSSYYGITTNRINVEILKLFNGNYVQLDSVIYPEGENSYIYLEQAGSYRLKFYDSCSPANIQLFKNSSYFDIIFLSHVPFVVVQTDSNGNDIITEQIQNAVYNGTISLKPTNLSTYYQASNYPSISVLLNGHEYTGYTVNNRVYTFTTPGYYTIKFSAKSTTGVQVREEEFNFTIINPNESRNAYEFTQYEKYYIEEIYKDGLDITEDLISMANFETVNINGKTYLSELSINYLDNKTGQGRYKIVINHNKPHLSKLLGENFSFELWINHVDKLPISISTSEKILNEGDKTSKEIVVTFNIKNLYNTVGDCYIKIGDEIIKYYTAETITTYNKEIENLKITEAGTYYVQVYTTGGQLLYSFKVVKTDPLNAFAILAIVIGTIAFCAVVFITVKLRKRQKVK